MVPASAVPKRASREKKGVVCDGASSPFSLISTQTAPPVGASAIGTVITIRPFSKRTGVAPTSLQVPASNRSTRP